MLMPAYYFILNEGKAWETSRAQWSSSDKYPVGQTSNSSCSTRGTLGKVGGMLCKAFPTGNSTETIQFLAVQTSEMAFIFKEDNLP